MAACRISLTTSSPRPSLDNTSISSFQTKKEKKRLARKTCVLFTRFPINGEARKQQMQNPPQHEDTRTRHPVFNNEFRQRQDPICSLPQDAGTNGSLGGTRRNLGLSSLPIHDCCFLFVAMGILCRLLLRYRKQRPLGA